jgi:hypothetical protein
MAEYNRPVGITPEPGAIGSAVFETVPHRNRELLVDRARNPCVSNYPAHLSEVPSCAIGSMVSAAGSSHAQASPMIQ